MSDIWVICQKCQFKERKGWKDYSFSWSHRNSEVRHALQTSRVCHIEIFNFWIQLKYFSPENLQWYSLFLISFNGTNLRDLITRQTYVVLQAFGVTWAMSHLRAFVANQGLSRIRAFFYVLSRLLLRHWRFCSDFVQISAQKIGFWDLWWHMIILRKPRYVYPTKY